MSDFDADSLRKKVQEVNKRLDLQGFRSTDEERQFKYMIESVTKHAKQCAEQGMSHAMVSHPIGKHSGQEYHDKVIKKMKANFQSLGFKVEVHLEGLKTLSVRLDW